ncbi:ABC transporter substrate-binding protein (plasmid) [Falsihalocynthiibacter sp. SS001]|uniref:ABC transporter substrate-binding protein n=1 Tax=Falsihalocynthiibacter sp. SS001 TaxID=3349698 RepID=UPI0036D2F5B8
MDIKTAILPRALAIGIGVSQCALSAAWADDLTVWAWDPNFNGAAMEKAAEIYKETHPDFNLVFTEFAREELEQKLQTQLAAGVTDGLPDIVLIEDYSAQKFVLSFPGAFAPMTQDIDYSKFADYKVALATVGDETYSMPFDSGVTGWFYRSDILSEAGYSAEDLNNITWDRLIEIGKDVFAKTGTPLLSIDANDPGLFVIMLQSTGGWFFDENGDLDIVGNEKFKAALADYAELLQAKEVYKPITGWSEFTGSFTSGDVASAISGVWLTGTIKSADMSGQWAVAPIPRVEEAEGAVNASNLGGSSWYMLSAAPNPDLAKDFLQEVWASDIDFYQDILVGQGAVGSLLAVREGEAYQSTDDYFGGQAVWQDFSNWLGEIPGVDYGIFTYEVRSAIASQAPALANGGDLDEAIEKIEAEARVLTQ